MSSLDLLGSGERSNRSEMGTPILQTDTNRTVYTFRNQKFWAKAGRIHVVDETTGEYRSCTRREFLLRLASIDVGLHRLGWADEKQELRKLISDGAACCKQAGEQKNPMKLAAQAAKSGLILPPSLTRASVGASASYPDVFPKYSGVGTPATAVAGTKVAAKVEDPFASLGPPPKIHSGSLWMDKHKAATAVAE